MEITEYSWWGGDNPPPENLKTKKQLSEIGLSPLSAVGVIHTKKYSTYLYDINNQLSSRPKRKCTADQLAILEANRVLRQEKRILLQEEAIKEEIAADNVAYLEDRQAAVEWAKRQFERGFVILDTETTGLGDAEIVDIAIVNANGEALLDTLVKPTISIPAEVTGIHGIYDTMVADSPTFPEIYQLIESAIAGKTVLIYNSAFDRQVLAYCCELHGLPKIKMETDCIMLWYAQWYGDWSRYYGNYKWQPLYGNHRALGDCLAALDIIKCMADMF